VSGATKTGEQGYVSFVTRRDTSLEIASTAETTGLTVLKILFR